MVFFHFFWPTVRRFVRKHTKPIPEEKALKWKKKLSAVYIFFSWNALGFVMYEMYKRKENPENYKNGKFDKLSSAEQYSQRLGVKKADVLSISPSKMYKYKIDNTKQNDEEQT